MPRDRTNRHPGNNLDLLRLFFATLVLLSHAPELNDGGRTRELLSIVTGNAESFGEFAVAGFFALSGYLIMASWHRHPQLSVYFRNRVLRIYPGFIVAFCLSVLVVGPLAASNVATYFNQFSATRYFFSMFTLREPWFALSFPGLHDGYVNGAMWTISYEFVCYIAVAAIGWCAREQLKLVWLILTALLLLAACFLPELQKLPQINRFWLAPLVRMSATFFFGGVISLAIQRHKSKLDIYSDRPVVRFKLVLRPFQRSRICYIWKYIFLSIGLAKKKVFITRDWPDISYGTYLYGWPVLQLIIWTHPELGPWPVFVWSLVISLTCGYLSWTFVEAPFMRLKPDISKFNESGRRLKI